MTSLIAAAAFFVLIHLAVSGTSLRDALVRRLGAGPYAVLFSLASLVGLVWLGFGYAAARSAEWNAIFWGVTPATRHIQLTLQLVAFLLIVIGQTTPNPTSVQQEGVLDRPDAVKGVLRITRHPFLWGVAVWATGHLIVNGDLASFVLFGSLLVLALAGTTSIDAKRRRALGDRWTPFAAQTSNVPFAAIVSGRQSLRLGEIGLWRPAAALAVYAVLALAHPLLFGVRALP